jgi:hypothetical protein
MRPDAGELRCSVLTDKIFRAVRDLNPSAKVASEKTVAQGPLPAQAFPAAPKRKAEASFEDRQRLADDALKSMTTGSFETRESLTNSPIWKFLDQNAHANFVPTYFTEKRVIASHAVELHCDGRRLTSKSTALAEFGRPIDEVAAVLDLFVYDKSLEFLESNATKALSLVITPVNLTTILRARYRAAYLEEGTSDFARQLLVLRVGVFTCPYSRLKINDAAGYLRQRSRALIADVVPGDGDLSPFKAAGFTAVGFDVRDQLGLPALLQKSYPKYASRASASGLRSYLLGATRKDDVLPALNAEFSYIGGTWFST